MGQTESRTLALGMELYPLGFMKKTFKLISKAE